VTAGRTIDLAEGRKSWSFQPLRPVTPPAIRDSSWPSRRIDTFLLAVMEQRGPAPSPPADRRTLVRRVTFDLTGLPPTPEEAEAFVNDPAPDAYEKLVDRLLGSPRYGERWALFWLDLVRFAESDGFKADDPRPAAWRYREADAPVGRADELAEYRRRLGEWEAKTAELRQQLAELEEPVRQQLAGKRRGRFPKEYADLLDVPEGQRDPLQKQIAAMVLK